MLFCTVQQAKGSIVSNEIEGGHRKGEARIQYDWNGIGSGKCGKAMNGWSEKIEMESGSSEVLAIRFGWSQNQSIKFC